MQYKALIYIASAIGGAVLAYFLSLRAMRKKLE